MDATAFNRCEPATAGSARRVFTGKKPDNVDGQNGRVIAENARAECICLGSFCCYTT
ncbi:MULTISPECIES: hypothetical protein [Agrobacterium]|uniref:hypothetical protein n=1 Tax=Agrobacterium TaxID=357 RepID=UPI0013148819|nr:MULTISPECIES: hypothetical protein [Agrobacterium]